MRDYSDLEPGYAQLLRERDDARAKERDDERKALEAAQIQADKKAARHAGVLAAALILTDAVMLMLGFQIVDLRLNTGFAPSFAETLVLTFGWRGLWRCR